MVILGMNQHLCFWVTLDTCGACVQTLVRFSK